MHTAHSNNLHSILVKNIVQLVFSAQQTEPQTDNFVSVADTEQGPRPLMQYSGVLYPCARFTARQMINDLPGAKDP